LLSHDFEGGLRNESTLLSQMQMVQKLQELTYPQMKKFDLHEGQQLAQVVVHASRHLDFEKAVDVVAAVYTTDLIGPVDVNVADLVVDVN
jgi:hypothetical protein